MKNETKILNTYIDNVCKGIRDRKIKNEIKDELLSHLLEVYDKNIALGMTDENAQKDAVAHMGDSEAVSKTFKQIYPVSSANFFQETGKMFAWGLIYCMLIMYKGQIGILLLISYLFLTLNRIKSINKVLNTAHKAAKVNIILFLIFLFTYNNIIISKNIVIGISIFFNALTTIIYIITIIGLVKVRKELGEEKTYSGLGLAAIISIALCFTMVSLQLFIKQELLLIALCIIFSLLPAGLMYTISAEDIDRLGTGVPQEKKFKFSYKKFILFFSLSIFGIYLLFTSNIFTFYQPIEYKIGDEQNDVNEIKDNLIELGLPENVANELPESEIAKYKNATELQVDLLPEDTYSESYYTSYNFTLHKDDNSYIVRTLMVIEKFEDFKEKYYTEFFVDCYKYNSSDVFCKFLCDYDGVTKELLPIKSEPIEDNDWKDLHYVFPNTRNAKKHRVYISMTVKLTPTTDTKNYFFRHRYAQTRLDNINDPYEKYWTRYDDRLSCSIVNPFYIDTEDNNDIGFEALFEILENLPEDENLNLSELESTMEEALGQDIDSELLENIVNQITDEVSNP